MWSTPYIFQNLAIIFLSHKSYEILHSCKLIQICQINERSTCTCTKGGIYSSNITSGNSISPSNYSNKVGYIVGKVVPITRSVDQTYTS